jgi:hypothetical protein
MKKTRLMEIKKEFEITHSYEYDKRFERKKKLFFFSIERLLETKVKDEGLGDIITQCFLKYFSNLKGILKRFHIKRNKNQKNQQILKILIIFFFF